MVISHAGAWAIFGLLTGPLLAVCLLAALVGEVAQAGIRPLRWASLFRWERLSPGKASRRMFGGEGIFDVARALIAWGIGLGLLTITVWQARARIFAAAEDVTRAREIAGELLGMLLLRLLVLGWMLAIFDLLLQRRRFERRQSMSLEELRDELKESDGNPELRGMRRQLHQELSVHSSIQAVRRAKVLVVRSGRFASEERAKDSDPRARRK